MKSNVLKYSKGIGLSLILLLFTASFVEWSIQNEIASSTTQCEEIIAQDDDAGDDKLAHFDFFDEILTFQYIPQNRIIYLTSESSEVKPSISGDLCSRCILYHQLKIAA